MGPSMNRSSSPENAKCGAGSGTEPDDACGQFLAREAMRRVSTTIAEQAELVANDIDAGVLADRGGAGALRFFACLIRELSDPSTEAAGHA